MTFNLWEFEVDPSFVPEDHVVSSTELSCQQSPNTTPTSERLPAAHYRLVWISMMGDSWLWPRGTVSTMPNSAEIQVLGVLLHHFPGLTLIPGPLLHVSVCMAEYRGLPKSEPNREEKPPVIHAHTHRPTET